MAELGSYGKEILKRDRMLEALDRATRDANGKQSGNTIHQKLLTLVLMIVYVI